MVNGDTADLSAVPWQGNNTSGKISITVSPPDIHADGVHPGNTIEWWFVHGTFQGASVSPRHFMMSIFRYDLSPEKSASDDGYYVILSLLDPVTGKQSVVSRGEHRIIEQLFFRGEDERPANLDRDLMITSIDEIRAYGPPVPVTLEDARPFVEQEPFSFSWNDIGFRIAGDSLSLTFDIPESGGRCRFHLAPGTARYHMEKIETSPGRAMTYVTCPRLTLSGRIGDEPVYGTAWFDHQWGNSGWFLSRPDGGDLYGWDWAGITGTDGSDWIFLCFRNPKNGSVISRFAVRFSDGEQVRIFNDFSMQPLRFWTSPRTHVRYPVAMEITVPEASARFAIEPVTDDQEIPVLGFMRTVWEGAATASGEICGHPFTGTARLELQGYGYIFDFQQYIQGHIDRIRESIDGFIPRSLSKEDFRRFVDVPGGIFDINALNETIVSPCRDLLSREKKYWRPVFALLLLESLGIRSEKYQQLLSVVPELTHTGTLIIDDIEDNAELRRGDTCIHRRYGTDVAINAANTLYFLPSVLYSTHPDLTDKQRLEFYRITLDSFVRGHFGQAQDIYWTKNLTEANLASWTRGRLGRRILQMYEFKTASAAVAMAEAGCILAGAGTGIREACVAYARALGTAFQIADDIESFRQGTGIGGTTGDDLSAGKMTYVIARALALLDEGDRERLGTILCSPQVRQNPESISEGIGLVRKSGALAECQREARARVDEGWDLFSRKVPPSEAKIMLRLFSLNLIDKGEIR